MLTILLALTFPLFGALSPLFLWIISSKRMETGIHRFTLAVSSLTGGIGVIVLWFLDMETSVRVSAVVWLLSLLVVTWFFWSRRRVLPWVTTIPSLLGVVVHGQVVADLVGRNWALLSTSILGGLVLSATVFSMVLGHRFLNIVDLPIILLRRAVRLLLLLLTLRATWDFVAVFSSQVDVNGYVLPLHQFLQSFEGFFLFIALFFGTLLPLLLSLLTLRTIAIRSTQSATGLLYVTLLSVVIGDFFYKYYVLQFGLFL